MVLQSLLRFYGTTTRSVGAFAATGAVDLGFVAIISADGVVACAARLALALFVTSAHRIGFVAAG
jgi:hypothetical protein